MSDRTDLAALIHDALDADEPVTWNDGYIPTRAIEAAADALLAAGWRGPLTPDEQAMAAAIQNDVAALVRERMNRKG